MRWYALISLLFRAMPGHSRLPMIRISMSIWPLGWPFTTPRLYTHSLSLRSYRRWLRYFIDGFSASEQSCRTESMMLRYCFAITPWRDQPRMAAIMEMPRDFIRFIIGLSLRYDAQKRDAASRFLALPEVRGRASSFTH